MIYKKDDRLEEPKGLIICSGLYAVTSFTCDLVVILRGTEVLRTWYA